ncbi:hypothetical protein [Siccibacter colletis]|uniref:Uncharacterized protein n=1 Tax=Siccibacter colletis TaxID=1505757 RepID=A0ABY6JCF4_9ENTR|nr:hypothetical protein [Siccibacter colletis]UYU31525.1 hypothetical protein KFZ77_17105 [Siccibacter colletis]
MNKYWRTGIYLTYLAGIVLLMLFSGSKYEWMSEVDPGVSPSLIAQDSDNRMLFRILILIVITGAQLIIMLKSLLLPERTLSLILVVLALILAF